MITATATAIASFLFFHFNLLIMQCFYYCMPVYTPILVFMLYFSGSIKWVDLIFILNEMVFYGKMKNTSWDLKILVALCGLQCSTDVYYALSLPWYRLLHDGCLRLQVATGCYSTAPNSYRLVHKGGTSPQVPLLQSLYSATYHNPFFLMSPSLCLQDVDRTYI
jgi:hypothetical protein